MQEKLQRESLAGDKDVAGKNYESESAAYKLTISPYEREIYVITVCALPYLACLFFYIFFFVFFMCIVGLHKFVLVCARYLKF